MLQQALDYVKRGFAVFPLNWTTPTGCSCGKPDCASPGKHPLGLVVRTGVKEATKNTDTIRMWWMKYPQANVGIALGGESGVVAVDLDQGAIEAHLQLFPRTVIAKSKNGFHIYLKYDPRLKNGDIDLPLVDNLPPAKANVRSDGYYVVGVGSVVADWEYHWLGDAGGELCPEDCPYGVAPSWLLPGAQEVFNDARIADISPGSRHDKLKSVGVAMRKRGIDRETIQSELTHFNATKCKPPKDADEVSKMVEWVMQNVQPDPDKVAKETAKKEKKAEADAKKKEREENSPYALYCGFMADVGYLSGPDVALRAYRQDFYKYQTNYFRMVHDEVIEDELNRWLIGSGRQHLAGTNVVDKILRVIRTKPVLVDADLELPVLFGSESTATAKAFVPFRNGILDVKKVAEGHVANALLPHTTQFFSRYALDFDFDPDAQCPTYDRVAMEAFDSEEQKLLWEEIMGIHLYQPFAMEHFFVLQGEGANGKSVLATVQTALLGERNVSSVPLENFRAGDFSLVETYGKLANIITDQHEIGDINEGMLKQFVSRELMNFNRKFKPAFSARPTAFLTLCTNAMPKFADRTDGIWRRVVLFEFKKQVPYENQDRRLITPQFWIDSGELSGVFNKALAGLKRVIERGHLMRLDSMEAAKAEYRQGGDSVATFANECIEAEPYNRIASSSVYKAYKALTLAAGQRPLAAHQFHRRLGIELSNRKIPTTFERKARLGMAYQGPVWGGVKLTDYGTTLTEKDTVQSTW